MSPGLFAFQPFPAMCYDPLPVRGVYGAVRRDELPIVELDVELMEAVARNGRVVVRAPTGSGKSTQIPQMVLDHGFAGDGQIVVLQPRRLPARMLARFVAGERRTPLGEEVGYQVRFENVTSARTRIRYVTEGILLRQMLGDPGLSGISVIVFDEFHERHLYGDITLARALTIQETVRPDLKIVIMSATLDIRGVEQYVQPCKVLESEGRTYPVDMQYLSRQELRGGRHDLPVWALAANAFSTLVRSGAEGDVLVFMPGAYEIARTVDAIRNTSEASGFAILPLHGDMSVRDQDDAVAPHTGRKVIVSTNVAESSLTIEGIRVVIDSGLARVPRFDPYRGINTLLIEKISHASADQRAGRAGRTAPGRCVRLWTEQDHAGRPLQMEPEVQRLDLAEVALTLKASGVTDLDTFRWIDRPTDTALESAETLLRDLGAANVRNGAITTLGRRMLSFPVHPRYARMLLAGEQFGCVRAVALIAALTQGRDLLLRRKDKAIREARRELFGEDAVSDFFILMRAWRYADNKGYSLGPCKRLGIHAQAARQVGPLYNYFIDIARREGLPVDEHTRSEDADLQKCILTGFVDHLAVRLDEGTLRCRLVHGRKGELARESVVKDSPLFVAAEIREIGRGDGEVNVLLSLATTVEEAWLEELFPDGFEAREEVFYDDNVRRVVAVRQRRFHDLVLDEEHLSEPPKEAAARLLADEVIGGNLNLKQWDKQVELWILRLNLLAEACPELELPPITKDDRRTLIQQICLGAVRYKDIKDKAVWPTLHAWLGPGQEPLIDKYMPLRVQLSNGRKAKVIYSENSPPHISQRIQDLYDVHEVPAVAMGRIPLVVHILGPNHRPVQVTQDMKRFWTEHYPRIKHEMQRRYPKHEWR